MNKLIDLLNEYEWDTFVSIKWDEDHFKDDYFKNYERKIISKRYWFIKWLVENDKIDFYTILKENWTFRKEFYAIENKKEYERLIMLLSVEEKPIDFLISVLKQWKIRWKK